VNPLGHMGLAGKTRIDCDSAQAPGDPRVMREKSESDGGTAPAFSRAIA
jgi:hypothetical protein